MDISIETAAPNRIGSKSHIPTISERRLAMNRIGGVGIAWYRKRDYERVRAISNDAHTFPDTFEDWEKRAEERRKKFSSWDTSSSRHTSTQIHSPPGAAPTDTKSTPKDVWHSHPPRRIGSRRTCTRTDIDITRRLLPLCQLGPDAGPIVTQGLTADLPGGAPKPPAAVRRRDTPFVAHPPLADQHRVQNAMPTWPRTVCGMRW